MSIKPPSELSTSEASREFQTHSNALTRLIAMGRIAARKDEHGNYRISRESIEGWNARRVRKPRRVTVTGSIGALSSCAGI
jgi:hypothetical protein